MVVCPSCNHESPPDSVFCSRCGIRLADRTSFDEERKVVTSLLCDLVGFTSLCERADPEDVDRVLSSFYDLTRRTIESYGGRIEKTIGDAVFALFGVPIVHEDDPVRAVRAGLRIVEDLPRVVGDRVQARVGISTGEAFVRFASAPGGGEGVVVGDAHEKAAGLQAAAPPMGVVVGELTHDLTAGRFVYRELEPARPVDGTTRAQRWQALGAFHQDDVGRSLEPTPLVGREAELSFMTALFDKAVRSASPQAALVIGVPGIGKSRLVGELLAYVDSHQERSITLQGRCPAYGEGVTFWALGEIVKAHAGILDSDDGRAAAAKLEAIVPDGPDHSWMANRLGALVGLATPQAERDENFAAWLRYFEDLAAALPTVLVFEDLQWADEPLLDFLEYLAAQIAAVPLLLVAASRPELFDHHPRFVATVGRVNRIALEPLSTEETRHLVSVLAADESLAEEVVDEVTGRCGGNPFYAEESVRLLRDRGEEAPLPGTVQAVIAARVDALSPDHKALLADASVAGDVFWDGALAAMGPREHDEVADALRELAVRQLVRRERRSSLAGETQFAFTHTLAREVVYQGLSRRTRAEGHAELAAWMQGRAGGRAEDLAEILAHHYTTALELALAADLKEFARSLTAPAVGSLSRAGDRAFNLDLMAASRHYERALQLAPLDDPGRPALLARRGNALRWLGRFREAASLLEQAVVGMREIGARRDAAASMMALAVARRIVNDRSFKDVAIEAVALVEADGPSPEKVTVLAYWGEMLWLCEVDLEGAIGVGERAVEICDELRLPRSVFALGVSAAARCDLGDPAGLDHFDSAVALAQVQGLGGDLAILHEDYAAAVGWFKGPRQAAEVCRAGIDLARRRGIQAEVLSLSVTLIEHLGAMGEWDEALSRAADLAPLLQHAEDVWDLLQLRPPQALLLARRGQPQLALPFLPWLTEQGRMSDAPFLQAYALLAASAVRAALGDAGAAVELLMEWTALSPGRGRPTYFIELVPEAIRSALAAGEHGVAARLVEGVEPVWPVGEHALLTAEALLDEDASEHEAAATKFAAAASCWHDFGVPYEEGQALLGQGRCLVALGRASQAAPPLERAGVAFDRLGAKPASAAVARLREGSSPPRH